ncbi:hypothetical protein D3C79_676930 [compost metagenome]
MLFGDTVQAIPDALRKPRSGEEEQFDTGEEALAQRCVLLQRLDQLLPALGDRQVSGR